MNVGAYRVNEQFLQSSEVNEILSSIQETDWIPTIPDGSYSNEAWRVIKLITNGQPTSVLTRYPQMQQLVAQFQTPIKECVFYSILPGGELHPHRDVSGTLELGYVRFHVPLITNPKVEFRVSKKIVPMSQGELWALNTSYLHSVANFGDADRIHIVLEVKANDWAWSLLPRKNLSYYVHMYFFFVLIGMKAVHTVLFDRSKLKGRVHLAKMFFHMFLSKFKKKQH